jgi:hypothetical protein
MISKELLPREILAAQFALERLDALVNLEIIKGAIKIKVVVTFKVSFL